LDTGGTVFANYLSGSGSTALTFRLTVASGELDADGVALGTAIDLNGSTLRDTAGNGAATTLNGTASTAGVLIDAIDPSVTAVDVPADGAYRAGQVLSFTVDTSKAVTVDTTGGTPRLVLDVGGASAFATYVSGSGSNALVFQYTVPAGSNDADGIAVGSLQANGGSVHDAAGNTMPLTLQGVASTAGVVVDTTAPTVVGITRMDATPTSSATVTYSVQFSENVSGVDAGDFTLVKSAGVQGSVLGVTSTDARNYTITLGTLGGSGDIALHFTASGSGVADLAGNALAGEADGAPYQLVSVSGVMPVVPRPEPEPGLPPSPPPAPWTAPITFQPAAPVNQIELPTIYPASGTVSVADAGSSALGNVVTLLPSALSADRPGMESSSAAPQGQHGFIETGVGTATGLQSIPEIGDFTVRAGEPISIGLPAATFTHSDRGETITIEVRLADGRPLPAWLKFDSATGTLSGKAPAGMRQRLNIEVVARDSKGHRASSHIEVDVGGAAARPHSFLFEPNDAAHPQRVVAEQVAVPAQGRPSLAQQFDRHGAAARRSEHAALLEHLRGAATRA